MKTAFNSNTSKQHHQEQKNVHGL